MKLLKFFALLALMPSAALANPIKVAGSAPTSFVISAKGYSPDQFVTVNTGELLRNGVKQSCPGWIRIDPVSYPSLTGVVVANQGGIRSTSSAPTQDAKCATVAGSPQLVDGQGNPTSVRGFLHTPPKRYIPQ